MAVVMAEMELMELTYQYVRSAAMSSPVTLIVVGYGCARRADRNKSSGCQRAG
jgi:hypothetical protein